MDICQGWCSPVPLFSYFLHFFHRSLEIAFPPDALRCSSLFLWHSGGIGCCICIWRSTKKPGVGMEGHSLFSVEPIEQVGKILSKGTTSVHVTALDGLVNVNSLFTVAVFVGLSLTKPKCAAQGSSEQPGTCVAGEDIADNLLVFEVVSFSSFLFSSLVAQGLKLAIVLNNSKQVNETFKAHINNKCLRLGMLASACGSVMGSIFLVLSMVNVIQIRLGILSCRTTAAVRAVVALVSLVSTALVIYISTVLYAFTH